MNKILLSIIFIYLHTNSVYSQINPLWDELIIGNMTLEDTLIVNVIPIGFIFNNNKDYSPYSKYPVSSGDDSVTNYGGTSRLFHINNNPENNIYRLNHSTISPTSSADSNICYGNYKIEFQKWGFDENENWVLFRIDSLYIDYSDSDYPYGFGTPWPGFTNNFLAYYYSSDSIMIEFHGGTKYKLNTTNRNFSIWNQIGKGNTKLQNKSGFTSDSIYFNYPLKSQDFSLIIHEKQNECSVDLLIKNFGITIKSNENIVFNSSSFYIVDNINFTLSSNSNLIFQNGAKFRTFEAGSAKTITMGENAFIDVKSGASVNLNNTVFQSTNSSVKWKGIKLTDTYLDTISNCSFKNTDTCINLYNSDKCLARTKKIITGSKFENGVVKLSNVFNALISNDSFYSSNNNQYLLTVSNSVHPSDFSMIECAEEFDYGTAFNLNIAGNYFSGGAVQMYLNCLASEQTPFFIYGNKFQGTGSASGIGMVTNKISGDFRYNSFLNDDYITAVNLLQSNLNFYENSTMMSGSNTTLIVNSSSSARLAPVYSVGNYYWYGGYNKLSSANGNNLYIAGTSSVFLDKGGNCLTVYNSNYFHILTDLTGSFNSHGITATDNYWSSIPPLNQLECNLSGVSLNYEPYRSACPGSKAEPFDYDIIDRGDGIIDTVFITDGGDSMNGDGEDENVFGQALILKRSGDYIGSAELFKSIIDEYDTSQFLNSSLDELFSNYQYRDTSNLQSNTDLIFNELKEYLDSKITQHVNNYSFTDKAYSYYLMCLVKIKENNEAISGYENIMTNHPEPEKRLLASWDRSAITLLQNGSGQGDANISVKKKPYQLNETAFKDKPVHGIARSVYIKFKNGNEDKHSNAGTEKMIESKIIYYNPLNRNELDKKITDDLNFMLGIKNSLNAEISNTIISNYKLNQNYPNPFNPVTKITFSIPVSGNISIKVYDITGKEIKTLVNEFRNAGTYNTEFNSSDLSSGVYYYKMETGNFSEIKKMILIK